MIDRDKLKGLHTAGLTDREIAAKMCCHHVSVRRARCCLGLLHNWNRVKRREAAQRALKRWIGNSDMHSLVEMRWAGQRIAGLYAGYPPDVGPAEIRVLKAMEKLGGSGTRREIMKMAGRSGYALRRHGPRPTTVLGSLKLKGFVRMSGGARTSKWHVTDKLARWRAGRSRPQRGGALFKMVGQGA